MGILRSGNDVSVGSFMQSLAHRSGRPCERPRIGQDLFLSFFPEAHCLWTRLSFPQNFHLSGWLSTSRLLSDNRLHSGTGRSRNHTVYVLMPFPFFSLPLVLQHYLL